MERAPEPDAEDERGQLLGWLGFHRDALAAKCDGLTAGQLVATAAPPSSLSLLGLVRHLTEMEHHYLRYGLGGRPGDRPLIYCTDKTPEGDIEGLDASMVAASFERWHRTRADVDAELARYPDLSARSGSGWGTARRHVLKVVQEYARHNGHADLLRERIDGVRGE